jgi:GWxTD domain-containing protein
MSIDREQTRRALQALLVAAALLVTWYGPLHAQEPAETTVENESQLLDWSKGPVRWLVLPVEMQRLRQVSSPGEALGFIERFWARRDPDPGTPGNPFRENFSRLVEAADLLYAENGVRGSLTDRGRALILLGAPTGLRVSNQEALEWDPATSASDNVRVRYLPLEIWTYEAEDFGRPLRLALKAITDDTTFRVIFVKDVDHTSLSEGEELLELATRTALALP